MSSEQPVSNEMIKTAMPAANKSIVRSETPETYQGARFEYQVYSDFSLCEDVWRDFESTAIATPFQSIDWLQTWWDAYQKASNSDTTALNIVMVYKADEPVLVIPLAVEQSNGLRRLTWLCAHLCDYNAPVIAKSFINSIDQKTTELIWSDIEKAIPGIDLLYLPKQPKKIADQSNPFYIEQSLDTSLQYHLAGINGDWQTYYATRRKGKSRRQIKARVAFMRDKAGMTIDEIMEPEKRAEIITQTINWKREQVAGGGAIDPFTAPETSVFFNNLAMNEKLGGVLRVYALAVEGRAIASAFGITEGNSLILYQTSYIQSEYDKYSPGVLLLIHMMEKLADEGCQVFDFSIGDEPYKFVWADQHENLSLTIKAYTTRGKLALLNKQAVGGLKRWIKKSDRRFAAAKKLNRKLRQIMGPVMGK